MERSDFTHQPIFEHKSVVVAPSWHCDARCSHCFVPVRERRRDSFDGKVERAFFDGLPDSIRWVVFTGGEPFLHPRRLFRLVKTVSESSRSAVVVTNGAWSIDPGRMDEYLSKAWRAGLRTLTVSVDGYHRPAVPMKVIAKLITRARDVGVNVYTSGVGRKGREKIKRLEEQGLVSTCSDNRNLFDLERVGQAAKMGVDRVRGYRSGGCRSAMEPLIFPDGRVLACCSNRMFSVKNSVLLRGNVLDRPVGEILLEASRDYLVATLAALGPVGLLELLDRPVPQMIESPCWLCLSLLNDEAIVSELRDRLRHDKRLRQDLVGRHMMYQAGGGES